MAGVESLASGITVRSLTPSRARPESTVAQRPTQCSTCALRSACLPSGMQQQSVASMDEVVYARRRIRRGEHLYHAGDAFRSLYAFRVGFFKTYIDTLDGQSQVTGFPMAGDVVGMDGIASGQHRANVIALDDGEVCVIPYAHFQAVAQHAPAIQTQLHKMMSREIVREQEMLALLGSMRAEPRVAAFLLALSERFAARGYSAVQFHLRMAREEIGSYLGLKLETVSRALSRFQEKGLIKVQLRSITIVDLPGLKAGVSDL
jgi:CRP/FNR family transcriptional regulator